MLLKISIDISSFFNLFQKIIFRDKKDFNFGCNAFCLRFSICFVKYFLFSKTLFLAQDKNLFEINIFKENFYRNSLLVVMLYLEGLFNNFIFFLWFFNKMRYFDLARFYKVNPIWGLVFFVYNVIDIECFWKYAAFYKESDFEKGEMFKEGELL